MSLNSVTVGIPGISVTINKEFRDEMEAARWMANHVEIEADSIKINRRAQNGFPEGDGSA